MLAFGYVSDIGRLLSWDSSLFTHSKAPAQTTGHQRAFGVAILAGLASSIPGILYAVSTNLKNELLGLLLLMVLPAMAGSAAGAMAFVLHRPSYSGQRFVCTYVGTEGYAVMFREPQRDDGYGMRFEHVFPQIQHNVQVEQMELIGYRYEVRGETRRDFNRYTWRLALRLFDLHGRLVREDTYFRINNWQPMRPNEATFVDAIQSACTAFRTAAVARSLDSSGSWFPMVGTGSGFFISRKLLDLPVDGRRWRGAPEDLIRADLAGDYLTLFFVGGHTSHIPIFQVVDAPSLLASLRLVGVDVRPNQNGGWQS